MRCALACALLVIAAAWVARPAPDRRIRRLPAGVIELAAEMPVPGGTELRGAPAGTTLRAAPNFRGRALLVLEDSHVRLRNLVLDGNRAALEIRAGLPPSDQAFADYTRNNGVFAKSISDVEIRNVHFREIAGFAVLASGCRNVSIEHVTVEDSGSRKASGRNNGTGGILLEDGTSSFRVLGCTLRRIRGNGIWTHSRYTSPRNLHGQIDRNHIEQVGRDAIQIGHASDVLVRWNTGARIGFPPEDVDVEGGGIPVAIDTAGNVDRSRYISNRFEHIEGKCIDLDGFHDGEVRRNICVDAGNYGIVMNNSNPDMQSRNIILVDNEVRGARFGGIFVIGSGHLVSGNRLLELNRARYGPGQLDVLRAGIYLGSGAERPAPATRNTVEENVVTGFDMAARCIGVAPGLDPGANTVRQNRCRDH